MNICIVSTDYPAPSHPKYVFVEQLVNEMVNQGVDISVIAPQSITRHLLKGDPLLAVDSEKKIGNRSYHIYRPKYLTLGNAPRWIQNKLEWLRYKVIFRRRYSIGGSCQFVIFCRKEKAFQCGNRRHKCIKS